MDFKFIFLLFGVFYFLCWTTPFAQGKNIFNDETTALKNLTIVEQWIDETKFEDNFLEKNGSIVQKSDGASESSEYYEEYKPEEEPQNDSKFVSKSSHLTLEHIDYVQIRLNDIARRTTSNITQLRELQKSEFQVNKEYKDAWNQARKYYNSSKNQIFKGLSYKSLVRKIPEEYHIALIAYSNTLYMDFNKDTREVCSGHNVDDYQYKSYFKLLILAIEELSKEPKFHPGNRYLYRGVTSLFSLEIGQVLAFQHFLSTSSSLEVAEEFAGNTLFEVHGDYSSSSISLKTHSVYPGENEVFISPFEIYQVKSKDVGYYTRYVLIKHKIPEEDCTLSPKETTTSKTTSRSKIFSVSRTSAPLAKYSNSATIYNKNYILLSLFVIFLCKF